MSLSLSINSTESASHRHAADDAAAFPEHRFPPDERLAAEYWSRVEQGRHRMAQRSVVICGLVRDLGGLADLLTARLDQLGSLFADFRVVLYENDSRDDTADRLQCWAAREPRAELLSEKRGDPVNPGTRCLARAERMAVYRNRCHAHVRQHHAHCDDVIVADTDLAEGWSYDGIANTFGHQNWDGVGSNGIIYRRRRWQPNAMLQYDAWAFRQRGSDAPLACRSVNQMTFRRGEPLVPVNSCFGGLAVYRMAAFLSASYSGEDTEHVPFHRRMRAAGCGNLFLNPSQIALYGRHHRSLDPLARAVHGAVRSVLHSAIPRWHD